MQVQLTGPLLNLFYIFKATDASSFEFDDNVMASSMSSAACTDGGFDPFFRIWDTAVDLSWNDGSVSTLHGE